MVGVQGTPRPSSQHRGDLFVPEDREQGIRQRQELEDEGEGERDKGEEDKGQPL